MNYKALICDLDGTTIPNRLDGMPSQKVIDAITQAKSKITVTIATGRAYWQAKPILDVLQLSAPIILLNGAIIMDALSGQPIYKQALNKEAYLAVTNTLTELNMKFIIDDHEKTLEYDPHHPPDEPLSILVWDITETQADDLIQTLSFIPSLALYKVASWNKGKVGLNVSHTLATKQHGILEVAKLLNIQTHDIIGVGDGPNDFPLLMACGLKIAMGNAIPDLKAIADYVAPSVEEDGVATVINKFILKA